MYAPVNAIHNSRITSNKFMYVYKLLQMLMCKLKIYIYAHTHTCVQSYLLNLHIHFIQPLSVISHTDNVHTWSYLKTSSAF